MSFAKCIETSQPNHAIANWRLSLIDEWGETIPVAEIQLRSLMPDKPGRFSQTLVEAQRGLEAAGWEFMQ